VPIVIFVNKLDQEGRDPFDLLDEIEQALALDVTPASWPIGMGRDFLGTYDLFADALLLFERGVHDRVTEPVRCNGLDDPQLPRLLPKAALAKLREEVEMAKGLYSPFDPEAYREGHLTPVYFPSALSDFGVRGPLWRYRSALNDHSKGAGFVLMCELVHRYRRNPLINYCP
jgi:peptide chain release factor 3